MTQFKLPVAAFGLKAFLLMAVVLWLVGTVAGYAGQVIDLWGLNLIAYVARGLLVMLGLWGGWGVLARILCFVAERVLETKDVEIALPGQPGAAEPEMRRIRQTVGGLARILAEVEQDGSQASLLLLDAEQYTISLVALIKTIVMRARTMRSEAEQLQTASVAIAGGDLVKIAQAAGGVRDTHIRALMLCNVPPDDEYWLDVTRLVATQLGTLEQWSDSYDRFASNLMIEVSLQKAKLTALTASLELMGAARPLLQIESNLNEAQTCLQPQRRPELAQSLKALPVVGGGLLQ